MGRNLRIAEGGFVYHVLNRGNGRRAFLNKAGDFAAFERVLGEAKKEKKRKEDAARFSLMT